MIPYVKMAQSFTVEELLKIFREKGYSVNDCWGGYSIIGRDGLETFYLACDDRLLGDYEESKDDLLRQLWDDDSRAIGLTVYRCEDCVVIGRGEIRRPPAGMRAGSVPEGKRVRRRFLLVIGFTQIFFLCAEQVPVFFRHLF